MVFSSVMTISDDDDEEDEDDEDEEHDELSFSFNEEGPAGGVSHQAQKSSISC